MQISKKLSFWFFTGLSVGALLVLILFGNTNSEQVITGAVHQKQTSRAWMEYTEDIVRADKPTPPASARLYAYVATAYAKTLAVTRDTVQASLVTRDILLSLSPEHTEEINALFASTTHSAKEVKLSEVSAQVKKELEERLTLDGFQTKWDGEIPKGEQYWVGENPFSPMAGGWKRWVILKDDAITAPQPPVFDSEEHGKALEEVKQSAMKRTAEQGAAVNFWGGIPGTEAPSGIWQNRLYDETKEYALSDSEYAFAQMVLAQALADSFMECWEEKYTYWTKRPSMVDDSIVPHMAMGNPKFPSYLSGHSTISSTAAVVLGALFPAKKDLWITDAEEARDSRLWAGIHFPYDNVNGFELGKKIGEVVTERLLITPLR